MSKFDVYNAVTERIITQLEKGIVPWEKPWTGVSSGAVSGTTGKAYSLLNQILLEKSGKYYTMNQVNKLGGRVRKGSTANMVVFWKQVPVTETIDGITKQKTVPLLKYYSVFHESQCDGLPEDTKVELPLFEENLDAEAVVNGYVNREEVKIFNRPGDEAYYSPARDVVVVPLTEQFTKQEEYYSTLFHELVHSTGHKSRLNRITKPAAFGDEEYSKEELVAEIGSSAILNKLGLETNKSFRNNVAYIQSWITALKNDSRMIVSAASKAQKAVDLIFGGV